MDSFKQKINQLGEYGEVTQVKGPIAFIKGLPGARVHELLEFESGQKGEVFSLNRDYLQALVFSKTSPRTGTQVVRSDVFLSVPVGEELLGQIIDPLGNPLSFKAGFKTPKEQREIDIPPSGLETRLKISRPFFTGVMVVDLLNPLGKGQKELIIGDRKVGKSAFLLSVAKTQLKSGSILIYALIGKKASEVKKIEQFLKSENLLSKTVVVSSSPDDAPSLIRLTPYTAMTIAEYFKDLGQDVLLVLDDLSTHAQFYREISLTSRRFPGRDSYPGDIFYIHAKLLERVGNFKHPQGEASITALPVVETIEGDLTGYLQTNLMGMTDGHIFFDSNIFSKGIRPAVNTSLSVTRVGKQVQSPLLRLINLELATFLSVYEKTQNLSHFGAELTEDTKQILKRGDRLMTVFNQEHVDTLNLDQELVLFAIAWAGLDEVLGIEIANLKGRVLGKHGEKLHDGLEKCPDIAGLVVKAKQMLTD